MSFPEIWCEEHRKLAPKIRGGMNPSGAFKLVYQSIDEWILLGNFVKAEGYEYLRCQLLYQADLDKYVNNSLKNMIAKLTGETSVNTTPRPQKRKLEAPQGPSTPKSSPEKRMRLTPKITAGRYIFQGQSEIEEIPPTSPAVVNDVVAPLPDFDDLVQGGIEVPDVPALGNDALWPDDPLDTTDNKLLQELFGCDNGNLDVPDLFALDDSKLDLPESQLIE